MIQVALRAWPAEAVHDTVAAALRDGAFTRSLQTTLAERMLRWIGGWIERFIQVIGGAGMARAAAIGFAALLVALVIARLVLAARARDPDAVAASRTRRARGEDPWHVASRLRGEGRFEEAAHALYRAVLLSLARAERVRLEASKTSGDYARDLRGRNSPAYAAFRSFSRRFDQVVYGHEGCSAETIDELIGLASSFAPAARAA